MARPIKQGLDYFPLDTVLDDKFSLIEAEFGSKGFAVVVKLFQKIYLERGYYCEWSQEVALMFARKYCPDVGVNAVSEIVAASIRRGIFDKNLFDTYGILTSRGIQNRYVEATKRRAELKIESAYRLISNTQNYENVCNNSINVCNNSINVCNNDTKKIKENKTKVNKIKEEDKAEEKTEGRGKAVVVFDYYRNNINPLPTKTEIDELNYWLDLGFEERLVKRCIEIAALSNKRSMKYIAGILRNLDKKGIKTLKAFESSEKIRESEKANIQKTNQKINQNANAQSTKFSNFRQREYDENKFKEIQEMQRAILDDYLNDE